MIQVSIDKKLMMTSARKAQQNQRSASPRCPAVRSGRKSGALSFDLMRLGGVFMAGEMTLPPALTGSQVKEGAVAWSS